MRLGISSYTYGWAVGTEASRPPNAITAHDLIDRAAGLGIRVLQLCDNLPPATFDESSLAAIAGHAEGANVSLELGTGGSDTDYLGRFAALARRVDSPILRVVVDTPSDHPPEDELVRRLRTVMPAFERAGVTLAIENHDRFRCATLARIVADFRGAPLGICLDTANSFAALEGPEVVVETLGPYVVNLHLKDFAVTRLPHLQGFTIEGRPAGAGMLDVPWLLGRLAELGRDPNAILELWTPPGCDAASTIAKEAEWASAGVRNLRQWIKE
jgi:sugar phosphate isomerase/epimerase